MARKVTDDAAAVDSAATTPDSAAAAVKAAVSGYDPSTDYRVWKSIAELWKQACHDQVEIVSGLIGDGKPEAVLPRLKRELAWRLQQESGAAEDAIEQFRKSAEALFIDGQQNEFCGSVLRQIESQERAKAEAREASIRREQDRREQRAAELERQAEALRQGPVRPASFIQIPAV
jgi:hypothetical protein